MLFSDAIESIENDLAIVGKLLGGVRRNEWDPATDVSTCGSGLKRDDRANPSDSDLGGVPEDEVEL